MYFILSAYISSDESDFKDSRCTWLETTTLDREELRNKESKIGRGPEKKVTLRKNCLTKAQ